MNFKLLNLFFFLFLFTLKAYSSTEGLSPIKVALKPEVCSTNQFYRNLPLKFENVDPINKSSSEFEILAFALNLEILLKKTYGENCTLSHIIGLVGEIRLLKDELRNIINGGKE